MGNLRFNRKIEKDKYLMKVEAVNKIRKMYRVPFGIFQLIQTSLNY